MYSLPHLYLQTLRKCNSKVLFHLHGQCLTQIPGFFLLENKSYQDFKYLLASLFYFPTYFPQNNVIIRSDLFAQIAPHLSIVHRKNSNADCDKSVTHA